MQSNVALGLPIVALLGAMWLPAQNPAAPNPAAQNPAGPNPAGPIPPAGRSPGSTKQDSERLFVDSVVATVNDSTILQSKLFLSAAGSIRSAEANQGRTLSLREIELQIKQDLYALINRYQMAQSAKSFGQVTPDQIEQFLSAELERDKQDQVRDLGSYLALSEALERQGRTWPTYAQEQRIEKLHAFAEQFAIYDRLRKQSNLYLTPRMLRETYEQEREFFVRPAMAEIAMVVFRGSTAAADAQAAAELWRTGDYSSRDIAARFPGSTPLLNVRGKSLRAELSEFALAGPLGNVSDPMPRAGGEFVDVAKIMQYAPARNGQFADPEVQEVVRRMAENRLIGEFRAQALERAGDRTESWIYQNGRRFAPR